MSKEKIGIYQIKCAKNGRIYIGSSKQIYVRWGQHRIALRKRTSSCRKLQRVWIRYGEEFFEFKVIEECAASQLEDREQYWIDLLKPSLNVLRDVTNGLRELSRARAALVTHCPKGHEYTSENTMLNQGKRICKKCNAERVARVYNLLAGEDRERALQYRRDHYTKNRENYRSLQNQYAADHREEKRRYDKANRIRANELRRIRLAKRKNGTC